jgi:hypothetical protein
LLEGGISLVEIGQHYGKNELSIHNIWDKEQDLRPSFGWAVLMRTTKFFMRVIQPTPQLDGCPNLLFVWDR